MNRYAEGLRIVEEECGNGKDIVIAVSTVAIAPNAKGEPRTFVRSVSAYYEDGVFYVTTWGESVKMRQIAQNQEVGFAVCFGEVSGTGIAENLGWVMDPKNAALRTKLREVFAEWYDAANNEKDENCVILAIRVNSIRIFKDHGAVRYYLDLVNKTEVDEGTSI